MIRAELRSYGLLRFALHVLLTGLVVVGCLWAYLAWLG